MHIKNMLAVGVLGAMLSMIVAASAVAAPLSLQKYTKGKNVVNFTSENIRMAGHLFMPSGYTPDGNYRSIVVVTPNSGIKEQTAGIYAEKLAKKGFITLAFDNRTYGESGGFPRAMENGPMKVEDIKNAVSFIRTIPGVNRAQVAVLGICSGAGYSIQAASFDTRIKAVATVSGFVDFLDYGKSGATQYLKDLKGDPIDQIRTQIKWGNDARQHYYETGEVLLAESIPAGGNGLGEFWERAAAYYRNPKRGAQFPTYNPMRAAMSLDTRYAFNPSEHMELLKNTPFLAIVGTEALSAYFSEVAVERAIGEKELFKIKGAQHFDLYDQDQYVNQAVTKLASFYNKVLK